METKDNFDLDGLRRSWKAVDEALEKTGVVKEDRLAGMIGRHREEAGTSLRRVKNLNRFSLWLGVVILAGLLVGLFVYLYVYSGDIFGRGTVLTLFLGLSLVAGLLWDYKTYRLISQIRVDEMPVVEVQRIISRYRDFARYEAIAAVVWAAVFLGLFFWAMEYHKEPLLFQVIFLSFEVLVIAVLLYVFYKKIILGNLDDARKTLDELDGEDRPAGE